MISFREALKTGGERLGAAGIESFRIDACVLLQASCGKRKEWIFAHEEQMLREEETERYYSYISRREKNEPVQYIVNCCEFMGLMFYVDKSVLIPRCDTEILAERVIEVSKSVENPKILDLCTGSGCIAVSVAYYNPNARVTGADISSEALEIARKNAGANGVSGRTGFVSSNLFEEFKNDEFDIIASNPPYIAENELNTLPPSVKDYEPRIALDGGKDGLVCYRNIAASAVRFLSDGGWLMLETGCFQTEAVVEILNENGYNNINIYKDLSGLNRVIEGKKNTYA